MPTTVNGVGTHYWGNRNPLARDAQCPHCGRAATLRSYDTTLFLVVIFIPVIPLARKRIIDECASCRRHYAVPLKVFQEARAKDYAEADRQLAAARTDDDAAKAVALVLQYREPDVIYRMIREGDARFGSSPVWSEFLVEAYRFLSAYAEAEASAARSLAAREDDGVRASLAEFQLARDDLDAALETLEPLLEDPTKAPPARAVAMATTALQRRGRHAEALELMSRLAIPADASPELVKSFAKLRETSEKTLARSLVEPEKFEIEQDGQVVRCRPRKLFRTKIAACVATTLALAYAGYGVYLGAFRSATLVNGTGVAYVATVGGKSYTLQPHEVRPIRVSEGDIAIAIVAPGYTGAPKSTFHVSTPWWRRPVDHGSLVLNPDGLAAILTRRITYGSASGHDHQPPAFDVGEVGYVLRDVDYAFTNPPASVTTKGNQTPPSYRVAFADNEMTPADSVRELLGRKDPTRAAQVARLALNWPVADAEVVETFASALGPPQAIAALAPRVAIRPIERESHRAHQNLRERAGEQDALAREYAALLAADPSNGTLAYLLGRTKDGDREAALALYRQAQNAAPPEPMGFFGEAYLLSARGDYEPALVAARAARAAMPGTRRARAVELDLLMATRRHAEVLTLLNQTPPADEPMSDFVRRLEAMAAIGRTAEIDAAIERRKLMVAKRYGDEDAELDARWCRATACYLRHDERGYAEACPTDAGPGTALAAALSRRDLATAEKILRDDADAESTSWLLLYLAADVAGDRAAAARSLDRAAAARSLDRAIALGRRGTAGAGELAAWLAGERVPTERELLDWPGSPVGKSASFAALAAARPQLRSVCLPLVERFGYSRLFPHELIAASTAKAR